MTLDVAAGHYWIDRAQYSVNAKVTETHISWLIKWFGANTLLEDILTADVQALIAKRRTQVAPATVNRHSTELLRRIFKRAEKVYNIKPANPPDWPELILPEPKERIRELSANEEMRLMLAIREDYRPVLAFSLLTGLRQNEVLQLKWSQIDQQQGVMRIWVKGGYWRQIKIAASMWTILAPLRDHHQEYVFTYVLQSKRKKLPKGTRIPICKDSLKRVWKYALKEAKIEDYTWHDNRHTALTILVRTTGSLKTAQILAGHSDISTTARYAHATKDDVADALDQVARRAVDINHRRTLNFNWIA